MPKGIAKSGKRQCSPRVPRVVLACEVCGDKRALTPGMAKQRTGRFCSQACAGKAAEKKVGVSCDQCGQPFKKRRDHLHDKNYCSVECSAKARSKVDAKWRNPDEIRAYMWAYRAKNRQAINEQKGEWKRNNRDIANDIQRTRRDAEAAGHFSVNDWRKMKAEYGYRCLACNRVEPEVTLQPDHVLPLALGGPHCAENIQPLCAGCNRIKNAKHIDYRPGVLMIGDIPADKVPF